VRPHWEWDEADSDKLDFEVQNDFVAVVVGMALMVRLLLLLLLLLPVLHWNASLLIVVVAFAPACVLGSTILEDLVVPVRLLRLLSEDCCWVVIKRTSHTRQRRRRRH